MKLANGTVALGINTWGGYGMASEDYLLQDANVPLKTKKGSIIDIILWAVFWLHLR